MSLFNGHQIKDHHAVQDVSLTLPRNAIVVYLINHRSNADYILVAYALAGRVSISYAVGEWARAFPLEFLFKRFGSYFIRRGYREALRHLWLRGADGMQIYNGLRSGHSAIALAEVQDAATVYDELLKHRDFLDHGEVMSFEVPPPQHDGAIWSGLRLGDHALVRVTSLTGADVTAEIGGWQGFSLPVTATADGVTYVVRLNREAGRMEVVSSDPPVPRPAPPAKEAPPAAAEKAEPADKPAATKPAEAEAKPAQGGKKNGEGKPVPAEKKDEGKAAEKK